MKYKVVVKETCLYHVFIDADNDEDPYDKAYEAISE